MNIAQPLSDILKERGISRSRLARDIKVHTSTVTNWLKGKDIKPDNLSALCDYFGCSPTLLIDPSKTEHYYMLQKNYGDKVAAAYISGDYDEYQKLLEEAQQKKPAPIAESEDRYSHFMRLFETLPEDRKDEVLRYIQFLSESSEHNK